MKKGVFTISIDYEFAWGYADKKLTRSDRERIEGEVKIVERLLTLFEKYNIPATWAIVGHLLECDCNWEKKLPHSEYPRPIFTEEKRDWFFQHPEKGDLQDVLWFDTKGLIKKIAGSKVNHEIGSHSYAHIIYNKSLTNGLAIGVDIENMKRIHTKHNLPYDSFVFPRNIGSYHTQLAKAGVKYYRGNSRKWYSGFSGSVCRIGHLVDQFLPFGRVVVPCVHSSGLINVPDSMLLLGRNGLRKTIKSSWVVRKALAGIKKAARQKKVFHLWFHPSNFSYDTETQFRIFEEILKEVKHLQVKGSLDVMTMCEIGSSVKK
ncbi:MAG: polysaccharide deacetylase family protein [Candidatus Pacebacteria bacterium]|nr:polysaccharide deacetylase family protein [Candidatus Paceibacterota bacterium]